MPAEKMKILIVDDHQGMRELMRSYLDFIQNEE
jgi:DNA-binding NarL/FixJ family response regulator